MKTKNKGNTLGIVSIATGWLIPLLGLVLGIIGLLKADNEKAKTLNTIGIAESILFWIFWAFIYL